MLFPHTLYMDIIMCLWIMFVMICFEQYCYYLSYIPHDAMMILV